MSALEEYNKNAKIDRTRDNLKLLKKIDRKTVAPEFVDEVCYYQLMSFLFEILNLLKVLGVDC